MGNLRLKQIDEAVYVMERITTEMKLLSEKLEKIRNDEDEYSEYLFEILNDTEELKKSEEFCNRLSAAIEKLEHAKDTDLLEASVNIDMAQKIKE
jgi:hypothetical protein